MVKKDIVDPTEAIRRDALAAVTAQQNAKPAYAGTYEDQISQIYDKIQNREPFKYDVNADPLYQQYKDQYIQGGKLAMKDTMGQAAALTGGYGSTYGQQVGQQAYDAYLQNLSAAIPELYGMAYNMYKDQGDDLLKQYSLAGERADKEYSRYRDAISDWNYQDERDYNRKWNENDRAYTRAWNEDDRAYSRAWNEEDRAYTRGWNEDNRDYTRQQTDYSNLIALIRASGYVPTQEELEAAGLSLEAARALIMDYLRSNNLLDTPYGDSLLDLLSGDTSTDSTQSTEELAEEIVAGPSGPSGPSDPDGPGDTLTDAQKAARAELMRNLVGGYTPSKKELAAAAVNDAWVRDVSELNLKAYKDSVKAATRNYSDKAYKEAVARRNSNYTMGELIQAAAAGASKAKIEEALKSRGVNPKNKYVQADIERAFSK